MVVTVVVEVRVELELEVVSGAQPVAVPSSDG